MHSKIEPFAFPKKVDLLTKQGAGILCMAIEHYWHSRGHIGVKATKYETDLPDVFGVRSNLVGGMPPTRQ